MADAPSCICPKKSPDNLYDLCLTNLVKYVQNSKCKRHDLRALPDHVLMDVYVKMLQCKNLCILGAELSQLDTFERLLRFGGSQLSLLQCVQTVIGEHGSKLSSELASSYLARCDCPTRSQDYLINLGLRLGGFLNEAGWYEDAQRILHRCRDICQAQPQTERYKRLTLECLHWLLNTDSAFCCFPAAAETYALALRTLGLPDDVTHENFSRPDHPLLRYSTTDATLPNRVYGERLKAIARSSPDAAARGSMAALLARLCKEFSCLFFKRCDYNAAYVWSVRALDLLCDDTPAKCVRLPSPSLQGGASSAAACSSSAATTTRLTCARARSAIAN